MTPRPSTVPERTVMAAGEAWNTRYSLWMGRVASRFVVT